tara:strand:- start:423 stop:584 length:162 start_codon:yes stop_codon:yes gene_type:complete
MPKKQNAKRQSINPAEMLSPPIVLKANKEKQRGKQDNDYVKLDSKFLKSFFTM